MSAVVRGLAPVVLGDYGCDVAHECLATNPCAALVIFSLDLITLVKKAASNVSTSHQRPANTSPLFTLFLSYLPIYGRTHLFPGQFLRASRVGLPYP